jgi:hypothetical protein
MSMTSMRLPESLVGELDRIAESRDVTRSELIREALEHYVDDARQSTPGGRGELVDQVVTYPGSGHGDLAGQAEKLLRGVSSGPRNRSR